MTDRRRSRLDDEIEAWRRTWLIRQTPGYEEARERAERAARGEDLGEPIYTLDQLRARLNL